MSDLTNLEDLVELHLQDTGNLVFSTSQIDAAIRLSLMDYSLAIPNNKQSILTSAVDGAEISLSSLPSFQFIVSAWWPWSTTKDLPDQDPNNILSWSVMSDSGSISLSLVTFSGVPLTGDKIRLHYAAFHTITGLAESSGGSAATSTSVPLVHFSLLAKGAAGYALLANAGNRDDVLKPDLLIKLAGEWLKNYRDSLSLLSSYLASDSSSFLRWPGMDKYDRIV